MWWRPEKNAVQNAQNLQSPKAETRSGVLSHYCREVKVELEYLEQVRSCVAQIVSTKYRRFRSKREIREN